MSLLRIEGLSKRYSSGESLALDRVSFSVEEGQLVALVGESGSGKTTLLRLLAGFEIPSDGTIVVGAHPVCGPGGFVPPEKRGVGMVFQDCALFPHLTIEQNIAFGLGRLAKGQRREAVEEALALVGLDGLDRRYPHELSGGQQQRVALARALAPAPSLLLLDEPFSNLDPAAKERVRDEVLEIIRRAGTTALLVSHDTREMLAGVDKVAILRRGRLQQIDSPEQVYGRPSNTYVAGFFGKTNILPAKAVPGGFDTPVGLIELEGESSQGTAVALAIRPEHFALVEGSALSGNVERIRFQGEYNEVVLVVHGVEEGYRLSVYVDSERRIKLGDTLYLRPRPDKVQPLYTMGSN